MCSLHRNLIKGPGTVGHARAAEVAAAVAAPHNGTSILCRTLAGKSGLPATL